MATKRSFSLTRLTDLLEASYWDRPFRWLTFLAFSLLTLVGFYLLLHSRKIFNFQDRYGWETIQLNENRVQTLNYIFLNQSLAVPDTIPNRQKAKETPAGKAPVVSQKQVAVAAVPDTAGKTKERKNEVASPAVKQPQPPLTTKVDIHQPPKEDRIDLAIEYLTNELGSGIFNMDSTVDKAKSQTNAKRLGSLDEEQLAHIKNILMKLPADVCVGFLLEQRFRVRSYFWLIGGPAYWEVIFWSMFGVLASLLYIVSTATRDDNTEGSYKPSDVAYQFAKLLYAPLTTLVIIFAYHVMQGENNSMVDIEAGKGMLFFSFVAGFYSGRLMMFLERLKDILLPFDTTKPKSVTSTQADTPMPASAEDVSLVVRVNPTAVSTETLNDINEKFLDKTITVLIRNGLVAYKFAKTEDDQGGDFIASQVKPGSYVLKAFLSIPLVEAEAAATQNPLAVAGNMPDTDGGEPTAFSFEQNIEIGTDPNSRRLEILLNPDESQG